MQFASLAPAAPSNLVATANHLQVSLSWAASGAASFNLKRATNGGGPFTTLAAGIAGTNYTDTAVTNGSTYYYVVTAINGYGESTNSSVAAASVPFPVLLLTATLPNLVLSWPDSASLLKLLTATNVSPQVAWLPVTDAPAHQSNVWSVAISPTNALRFFKLSP
jgi:hypothetical protein